MGGCLKQSADYISLPTLFSVLYLCTDLFIYPNIIVLKDQTSTHVTDLEIYLEAPLHKPFAERWQLEPSERIVWF